MKRAPYDAPCDNDPIDHNARRFMVYGALPCRDRTFPGKTTVMFYLAFSKADRRKSQPSGRANQTIKEVNVRACELNSRALFRMSA